MEEVRAPMAKPSDCMYVLPPNWKQFFFNNSLGQFDDVMFQNILYAVVLTCFIDDCYELTGRDVGVHISNVQGCQSQALVVQDFFEVINKMGGVLNIICHKMHGTSAPPHRDVNITSAEETRANNHLDNKRITPVANVNIGSRSQLNSLL